MITDIQTLKLIENGDFQELMNNVGYTSQTIIKRKIEEIPSRFFELQRPDFAGFPPL